MPKRYSEFILRVQVPETSRDLAADVLLRSAGVFKASQLTEIVRDDYGTHSLHVRRRKLKAY